MILSPGSMGAKLSRAYSLYRNNMCHVLLFKKLIENHQRCYSFQTRLTHTPIQIPVRTATVSAEAKSEQIDITAPRFPFPVNPTSPGPLLDVAAESVKVLFPTSKTPDAPKLILVPETVTPEPPAEMAVPSIENAVGFAVKTCPATVKIEGGGAGASSKDPGTTIPDEPGVTVWLPMTYAPALLAVKV